MPEALLPDNFVGDAYSGREGFELATATAAAGLRTVGLADAGETTARNETTHDCTRSAGEACFDETIAWGHRGLQKLAEAA